MPFFAPLCTRLEASFSVLLAFTNKFNSFIPSSIISLLFSPFAYCVYVCWLQPQHKAQENLIKAQIVWDAAVALQYI